MPKPIQRTPIEIFLSSETGIIVIIPPEPATELLAELNEGGIPGGVWEAVSADVRQRITREVRGVTTMEENAEEEGYSQEDMRVVLRALAAMTYTPNDEDKAKTKGILDQARAKGLL